MEIRFNSDFQNAFSTNHKACFNIKKHNVFYAVNQNHYLFIISDKLEIPAFLLKSNVNNSKFTYTILF